MDRTLERLYSSVDRFRLNDDTLLAISGPNFNNRFRNENYVDLLHFQPAPGYRNENYVDLPPLQPAPIPRNLVPSSNMNGQGDPHEDYDFSDVVLKYISEILMEEDMEDKTCMFKESSAALQAAEKSFYEVLGERYPPSPKAQLEDQNQESSDDHHGQSCWTCSSGSCNLNNIPCNHDLGVQMSSKFGSRASSSHSPWNNTGSLIDGFVDSPVSTPRIPEMFNDSQSAMQFRRGFEEASRFLPNRGSLFVDVESDRLCLKELKEEAKDVVGKLDNEFSPEGLTGKKKPHPEDVNLDGGRSNKQLLVYTESTVSPEMFDTVLLNCQSVTDLQKALQSETYKNVQGNGQFKGSMGGKGRGRKGKRNVVDLRTLLTLCAQAVATDDRRNANELLKQIRQHSMPTGDGMQRLAHYFVEGLEARLAGSGTQSYSPVVTRPTSAANILKAYHLFLAACPFKKLSNYFSNMTIRNLAENTTRLHIIDFGVLYGFQWPCLIRRLSSRPGGPPSLKITGIDLPQPGFRPAERVEETGRRLANYAKTFNVPFEFHAIAQKWDTIQIEDLKIDSGEVLVVNCMHRLRNLLDETVTVESPRNKVLNLVRKLNPNVFILGIVNGAYSAPFFITRFREALFHYSTLFDMLETNVPRKIPERMLIEREISGWEVMNVIACEGAERIERPETYKQWQVRNMRAGFRPLPLNKEIMKTAKERVDRCYHKDFVIDEDNGWLLQGWKGRIVYAYSSWVPAT